MDKRKAIQVFVRMDSTTFDCLLTMMNMSVFVVL